MTSILSQLSNRSIPASERLGGDDVDLISYYVESQNKELVAAFGAHEAISNLADQFFKGAESISARDAMLYQVSVESILIAAGLPVAAGLLTPSFESSADYSTEADEKKKSMLTRIWEWIKEAAKVLMERIRKMLGLRYQQTIKISETIDGMLEDLNRLNDNKVNPFKAEGNYYYAFNGSGKFDMSSAKIGKDAGLAQAAVEHLLALQSKILKVDDKERFESSEDVYYDLGWAKSEEIALLGGSILRLEPNKHFIGTVARAMHGSTETTPLSLADIKLALNALKGFNSVMKSEYDRIQVSVKTLESKIRGWDAVYTAASAAAFEKYAKDTDEARHKNMFDDEKKVAAISKAGRDRDEALAKVSSYKYRFNAYNKVAVVHNLVTTEAASYTTEMLKVLRMCMGCYHAFEKAPKK